MASTAAPATPIGPPDEGPLDRLVRLAARLLQAPVALVALTRDGQPRLAHSHGLSEHCRDELATHPFWARIIASGPGGLALEGARQDTASAGPPQGPCPGLAAWLGVPLCASGGEVLGCLCVAQPQARAWSEEDRALLVDLAHLTGAGLAPPRNAHAETALLESIPHPCFALDEHWRFTYLNRRARQFFAQLSGRPAGRLRDGTIWEQCPEVADSAFARECQQALEEKRPLAAETFYPELKRWFAVHISPTPGEGLSVFLQDVSEQTELKRGLARRADELAEADRGKGAFLVQLAHEVRNALAPVRNALHLTLRHRLEDPEDERACVLAEKEVRRMSQLMDDLLEVSQAAAGNLRLNREMVNLAPIVARSLSAVLSSAAPVGGRGLTVHLPQDPVCVEADPEQLVQVLNHLLDNAARFTRPGGNIRVAVEREGGAALLRVQDDGVGIRPEVLPRIFDLFMRAGQAPAGLQVGMGIGLTLVRRLVELHGGTVEARSEGPGKGSEFIVRLPAPEEAVFATSEEPLEGALRVLVVEDSMDTAQSLAFLLTRWGHQVRVAYDGPRALVEAADFHPEVVLLDIGMPGMTGYEVAERLRRSPGNEKLVLVAVTGYGQDEDRERARQAGFNHHMVKPVGPAELQKLLATTEAALRG